MKLQGGSDTRQPEPNNSIPTATRGAVQDRRNAKRTRRPSRPRTRHEQAHDELLPRVAEKENRRQPLCSQTQTQPALPPTLVSASALGTAPGAHAARSSPGVRSEMKGRERETEKRASGLRRKKMQVLTPMMISLSSPASINICGVSSRATPFFTRSSSAFAMMSYIRFVERILRTALGLGIHGKRTVAGVVAVSKTSYNSRRRLTMAGSSASSVNANARTLVWKRSCKDCDSRL